MTVWSLLPFYSWRWETSKGAGVHIHEHIVRLTPIHTLTDPNCLSDQSESLLLTYPLLLTADSDEQSESHPKELNPKRMKGSTFSIVYIPAYPLAQRHEPDETI